MYLVAAIAVWTSPRNQRIGDRVAGTVVVKARGRADEGGAVRAPSQRRRLGVLFTVIAAALAAIALAAALAEQWVVAVAAGALAVWMATIAWTGLRARA